MLLRVFDEAGNFRLAIEAEEGDKFSHALWLSGKLKPLPLCDGSALCGKCKIRFLDKAPATVKNEHMLFSPEQLALGWRLACQHFIGQDSATRLELDAEQLMPPEKPPAELRIGAAAQGILGLDLGTTSIAWQCLAKDSCAILGQGASLNPQSPAGPDVVSRLNFARKHGTKALSRPIKSFIEELLIQLGNKGAQITDMCIAANSAMTEIFLNRDIGGLCAAPYHLSYKGGEIVKIVGIDCPVIFPPLPGPFVGGDISAGICCLLDRGIEKPFILADLGTNGELALYDGHDRLFYTSVPMGPALEGIGPAMGALAGPRIATSFMLSGSGLTPLDMNGELLTNAKGISATGYISLLAQLYKLGALDVSGHFVDPAHIRLPLAKKIASKIRETAQGKTLLPCANIFLTSRDVEMILMVKAAFSAALSLLLEKAACKPHDIRSFCIAGVLGQFAQTKDLISLGFFPDIFENRTIAAGNTALAGACILAAQPKKLDCLKQICDSAIALDLANDPRFQKIYLRSLHWKYATYC